MKHKILLWLMLLFFPLALGTSCNTEPVGVTLGFIGNGYDKRMSEGDIVHFHVISFKEWQWPKTADLRWPTYIGIVEFYDSE